MFNLLPEAEKESILAEYKIRRGIVLFAFLFILGLVALASIFPSYLFSASKVRDAQANIALLEHASIFSEENSLNSDLSVAKVKLTALRPPQNGSSVQSLVDAILSARSENVRLNGIMFQREANASSTIEVSGVAKDRQSLSDFVDALKKDPTWTSVDLPVSNFAKDQNEEFTLNLEGNF